MATDMEVANLVSDAYSPGTTLDAQKWRIIANDKGWFGFESTLYQRVEYNQSGKQCDAVNGLDAVLVFRGSEKIKTLSGSQDWFLNDVFIASGNMPPQAVKAISLTKQYKSRYPNLVLAGHSLGGALAVIASAYTATKAVTFNAPGVRDACIKSAPFGTYDRWGTIKKTIEVVQRCASGSDVLNYRTDGDIVSNRFFLKQSGETIVLSTQCTAYDILCLHGMEGIQKTLGSPVPIKVSAPAYDVIPMPYQGADAASLFLQ